MKNEFEAFCEKWGSDGGMTYEEIYKEALKDAGHFSDAAGAHSQALLAVALSAVAFVNAEKTEIVQNDRS